jgi:hypothetical protein
MAALASSAVSLYPGDLSASEWPSAGKDNRARYTRYCKVVLSGQGTAANPIPASAFGLSKLSWCSMLYDRTNGKGIPAVVDPTTNTILLVGGAAGIPADVTSAEAYIRVEGSP